VAQKRSESLSLRTRELCRAPNASASAHVRRPRRELRASASETRIEIREKRPGQPFGVGAHHRGLAAREGENARRELA
jgi:hypothetical protein